MTEAPTTSAEAPAYAHARARTAATRRPPPRPERTVPTPPRSSRLTPTVVLFSLTLLLSSALLFLVQPMFAKMVLPKLGGTPAVWNTCMVFFQAALLAGYAYAHVSTRLLGLRTQAAIHGVLLLLPLAVLPIALPHDWRPPTDVNPIGWLLLMLAVTLGLPFFVVSTSGPLLQKWFAATGKHGSDDPYFLYAASNAGSMVALVGYPVLVEPLLRLADQSRLWSIGYGGLVVLALACAARAWRSPNGQTTARVEAAPRSPTWAARWRWIALSFVPSSYLLGVTTYLTSDIAAVPLLWVVPLALYLLTFILVFASRPIVPHRLMVFTLPVAILAPLLFLLARAGNPIVLVLGVHLLAFFVATMVCHGELARSRPHASHLTEFYLSMSIGGVLGGLFNALAAPLLFSRMLEYPIAMALACFLCPRRDAFRPVERRKGAAPSAYATVLDVALPLAVGALAVLLGRVMRDAPGASTVTAMIGAGVAVLLCLMFTERPRRFALGVAVLLLVHAYAPPASTSGLLAIRRSFFGIHRVVRDASGGFNELYHGTTLHGAQALEPHPPHVLATYYGRSGPIGSVMTHLPEDRRRNVAVIGLGVGTLAGYAQPGSSFTFYEIDPLVRWAAADSGHFSFLADARTRATVKVVLGDARLTLAGAPDGGYDVLIVDAFSGDAIPVHLLTREAFALYRRKLAPGGVLVVHVSNMYLNLKPVVANLAADAGCVAIAWDHGTLTDQERAEGMQPSQWVAIAQDAANFAHFRQRGAWRPLHPPTAADLWTDDFSNLLRAFRWRSPIAF